MNKQIEINCRVRFLDSQGGGIVKRIEGNTVYVEDEDGFEIPTTLRQCVRVDEGDTFMPAYKPPVVNKKSKSEAKQAPQNIFDKSPETDVFTKQEEDFTPPKPHTLLKAYGEVACSLYAFPIDRDNLDASAYEFYLVNECQYSFYYTISHKQNGKWQVWEHKNLDPKEDNFIVELSRQELILLDEVNVQILAYSDNPKEYKGTFELIFNLDSKQFRNPKALQRTELFDDEAIVLPLVKDSVVQQKQNLKLKSEGLADKMTSKKVAEREQDQRMCRELGMELDRNGDYKFDLHIDALLDDTTGMDRRDLLLYQLNKFEDVLKANAHKRERSIVFIHGKGNGILRNEILKILAKKYPKYKHQDASFSEYSFGATKVTIK